MRSDYSDTAGDFESHWHQAKLAGDMQQQPSFLAVLCCVLFMEREIFVDAAFFKECCFDQDNDKNISDL